MKLEFKNPWATALFFFILIFLLAALFYGCSFVDKTRNTDYKKCTSGMCGYGAQVKKTKVVAR
jgi:hypothetical protein